MCVLIQYYIHRRTQSYIINARAAGCAVIYIFLLLHLQRAGNSRVTPEDVLHPLFRGAKREDNIIFALWRRCWFEVMLFWDFPLLSGLYSAQ